MGMCPSACFLSQIVNEFLLKLVLCTRQKRSDEFYYSLHIAPMLYDAEIEQYKSSHSEEYKTQICDIYVQNYYQPVSASSQLTRLLL